MICWLSQQWYIGYPSFSHQSILLAISHGTPPCLTVKSPNFCWFTQQNKKWQDMNHGSRSSRISLAVSASLPTGTTIWYCLRQRKTRNSTRGTFWSLEEDPDFEVSTCQPASLCGGCPNVSVEYKLHQHRIKHVGPLDQTYVTLIYLLVN